MLCCRFYLYKRDYQKVVQYANKVLGTNPINLMRKWDVDYDNVDAIIYDYVSVNQAANFCLPTSSLFGRIYGNRYGHNYDAMWVQLMEMGQLGHKFFLHLMENYTSVCNRIMAFSSQSI